MKENKGTKPNPTTEDRVPLKVLVPESLDRELEIRVAELRTTKREFVEGAIRGALSE